MNRPFALGVRRFRRSKAHAAELVATVALGTGTTCALWVVLYALLVAPLPYRDAERLTVVWDSTEPGAMRMLDREAVAALRGSEVFDGIATYGGTLGQYVSRDGSTSPQRAAGCVVDSSLLEVLGASPMQGTIRSAAFDRPAAHPPVVLSARLAARLSPLAIGDTIDIDRLPYTIVAILPRSFWFPDRATELWIPLTVSAEAPNVSWSRSTLARLKPGTTLNQSLRQASTVLAAAGVSAELRGQPYRDALLISAKGALLQLRIAIVLLLLLVLLNASWLFVAHVDRERRSLAICRTLGATSRDVVMEYLIVGAAVAVVATPIAVGIAYACLKATRALAGDFVPLLADAALTTTSALVALAVALALTVVAAVPALGRTVREASGENLSRATRGEGRRTRLRAIMMGIQVALVFGLSAQGISLFAGLGHVLAANVGFTNTHLLTAALSYDDRQALDVRVQVQRSAQVLDRLRRVGLDAALANALPLSGVSQWIDPRIEGSEVRVPPLVMLRFVTPSYFRVCGIPLRRGYLPSARQHQIAVSEAFTAQQLKGRDGLGERVQFGGAWWTIAGVVASVRDHSLLASAQPEMYVLYDDLDQAPLPSSAFAVRHPFFVASADRGIADTAAALRSVIAAELPEARIDSLEYFPDRVWMSAGGQPVVTSGVAFAACLALLLMAAGFNGLIKHGLSLRRQEIGIRLALGATRRQILVENLRPVLNVCAAGAVAGVWVEAGLNRTVGAAVVLPAGAAPTVLEAALPAAALLAAVVFVACYRPVAKAAAVDPLTVLRVD